MKLALILIVGAFSIGFCWDKHPLKIKKASTMRTLRVIMV
jgi:hypothetical protein